MPDPTGTQHAWRQWIEAFRAAVSGPGILYLAFTAGCVGLYYARALLSIYAGILFGVAVLNLLTGRDTLRDLKSYKPFIALMCVLGVYLLSGIHSEDLHRWWRLSWESILYVSIPLGFYAYRHLSPEIWPRLLMIYIGVTALTACGVLIDYAAHFEEYNTLYQYGKTIPTPITHVRYALFVAIAAVMALALWYAGRRQRWLLITGVFLCVFIHLLSVRTGLVALYGGLLLMLVFLVVRDRKWKLATGLVSAMIFLAVVAYHTFPTIEKKVGYMLYDLRMMREHGVQAEYSDNVRITSIRHGLHLFYEQPITGTGIGDLKAEMERVYRENTPDFPQESRYPPISQYVFLLAAFGVIGAGLIFICILYPLFASKFSYVLTGIYGAVLAAGIAEMSIELQLARTVFLSLVCIALLDSRSQEVSSPDTVTPNME